jgi:nicotinate-nucleotide adenylyltransferase
LRIALFGGTFNPIHEGHMAVAREALRKFELDQLLIVPASIPPHKANSDLAPYGARLRMVELASVGEPRIAASTLEMDDVTSYSVKTIEKQRARMQPGDRLFFLIGADAFAEIETWYQWRDVIASVEFIVVSRPGHEIQVPEGATAHRLETLQIDLSSSDIRAALRRGERPKGLPDKVYDFIRQRGLYGSS